jgi:hypothetical protein
MRNVSSRASTIRGGGGGCRDSEERERSDDKTGRGGDVIVGEEGENVGTRIISSVSKVRASMTWNSDVCCDNNRYKHRKIIR